MSSSLYSLYFLFFRSISGKLSTPRPASGSDGHHHMGGDNANSGSYPGGNGTSGRFLLREDDVMQLEFNTNGLFSRSKPRRLILLNDLLVCVAVNGRSSEVDPSTSTSTSANERLTLKWAVPVSDVEVSQSDFLKVLELVSKELKHFWGDCRFIPTDWGS